MENKKIQRQYAQAAESSTFCLNGFCNRNFLNGEEGGGVSQSAECLLLLDTDNILANYEHVVHTFGPVFDGNSRILILGSMPSVKSREQQFYYAHPQNRFWKVLAAVFKEAVVGCNSFLRYHWVFRQQYQKCQRKQYACYFGQDRHSYNSSKWRKGI